MTRQSGETLEVNMRNFVGKILLDKYFLQEFLDEGNFGAVYRCDQYFLGRPVRRVALKLSKKTGFDQKSAQEVFGDTFLLAQALDEMTDAEARSHLVHVYDAGILPEEKNRIFLVMEYVQGTTLAAQFDSLKKVPGNLMLKWALQICRAVAGLHTLILPIIHRDLKPDNILLGMDQRVRVADFGLAAKMLDCGHVPGTLGVLKYMAPEAIQGERLPASDVYTIGLLMYQGLTGRFPFDHIVPPLDLPERLHRDWLCQQLRRVRPTPVSAINRTIDSIFEEIILRCLNFRPQDRYHHAGHLLNDLERLLSPPKLPPDQEALREGQRLRQEGNLLGAEAAFKRGVQYTAGSLEARFWLRRYLGEVEVELGKPEEGVRNLVQAWELTQGRGFLNGPQRMEILDQIVSGYRQVGNAFQMERFMRLKDNLLSGR